MAKDAHMATTKELIQLGKSLGFRVYSSDDVGEPTVQLPKTIDLSVLSSADQIDVIWFNEFNFPKYAFEIEYTTGVDRGMQRLYQLRHYLDCKFFVVIQKTGETSTSYSNRFHKLKESDPYHTASDRFYLITDEDISKLRRKALELDKLKYDILEWELHPDVLQLVVGAEEAEEVAEEVPEWVSVGKGNWSRHFTIQRKHGKELFVALGERIRESALTLEVRIHKWHISLYSGGKMVAVIYPRKASLVFLIKNIEGYYAETSLEMVEKPETDYIIQSATRYLILRSKDQIEEAVRLLSIATTS